MKIIKKSTYTQVGKYPMLAALFLSSVSCFDTGGNYSPANDPSSETSSGASSNNTIA